MSTAAETCAACGASVAFLYVVTVAHPRDADMRGAQACQSCVNSKGLFDRIRARRSTPKPGPGEEWRPKVGDTVRITNSSLCAGEIFTVSAIEAVDRGAHTKLPYQLRFEGVHGYRWCDCEPVATPTPYQPKPGDLVRVVESFFPEAIGQTMRFEREDDAGQWVLAEIDPSPFRHSRFYMRKEVTRLEPAERKQVEPLWTKAFFEKDAEIRARQATDPYRTYNTRNPESVVALDTVLADAKRFDALSPLEKRRELHKRALLEALDRKSVGHPASWPEQFSGSSWED